MLTRAAIFVGWVTTTTVLLLAQQSDSSRVTFRHGVEKAPVPPTAKPAKSKRAQQTPGPTRNPDLDPAEELARPVKPPSAKPGASRRCLPLCFRERFKSSQTRDDVRSEERRVQAKSKPARARRWPPSSIRRSRNTD